MKRPLLFLLLLLLAGVIALFISAIQPEFNVFPRKVSGSFEYVRKGEALFDKDRYAESIRYFEKAYESSPENDTIKSDLVYAYSTYAKVLAEDDKYIEAIDYLEKAYNVAPNSSTTQNLGMMYAAKALHEAKKGQLSKAEKTYAKMREFTLFSGTAGRNIAILLYNDGVNEYKSGREDLAVLCLKESLRVDKEPKTLELLGDMYYKRAKFRMARFYWGVAKKLDPDNKNLSEKFRKVRKETALSSKEKEDELPHFEIRYKKNLPIDKGLASEILEQAYADVGRDLAYFPKERTKVFFYSKDDFRNIFNMPHLVNAFYDGSIKIPSPETRLDAEKTKRYIYHEYTHAVISAKTNNNCPVWLSEGIALWEEFRDERHTLEKFLSKIKGIPDISIHFLEENFKDNEVTENRALGYLLSYTLVDYILEKWGMAGLQGVLKRLADKQHIVNAIDDEFLLSEKQFERRWQGYTLGRYFRHNIK